MRHLVFLLAISVVLTAIMIVSIATVPSAEAAKASGMPVKQYGKNAETLICGDHLCTASSSFSKDGSSPTAVPDSTSLNAMFQRMDKIYKQHQAQIREKWSSLDSSEKMQFIQKMNDVMGKMESKHMAGYVGKMMDGNYKHGKMMDGQDDGKTKDKSCDKDARDKKDGYAKNK